MHNNRAPTISIHGKRNAFPLRLNTPNDTIQASWNDLQLSFLAFSLRSFFGV